MSFCIKCGNQIDIETKFCRKCGTLNQNYKTSQRNQPDIIIPANETMAWSEESQISKHTNNQESADSLNDKGYALTKEGKNAEAITYFDKALKINPKHWQALCNKGDACSNLGRIDDALAYYDKALEIDSNHPNVLTNKARLFMIQGNYKAALKWFDKALKIDPEFVNALFHKGFTYGKIGKNKKEEKLYYEVLEIDPQNADALNNLAIVYYNRKKFGEALKWIEKSLSLYPTEIVPLYVKGITLNALNHNAQGQRYLQKAREIDSDWVDMMLNGGSSDGLSKSEY